VEIFQVVENVDKIKVLIDMTNQTLITIGLP
jgi:hypothetical protein